MFPPVPPQIPFALLLLGCAGLQAAARAESVICGSVADEFSAEAAGLRREWIVQIPSGVGSWQVERVTVGGGLVVAQTGDGGVHAIQAVREDGGLPSGTLLWSRQLGAGAGAAGAAGIGPQVVTVAHDLHISAIDRRTGTIAWEKRLGRLPGAAAVPSGDWVYAMVPNEGVLRLPVNPRRSAAAAPPAGGTKNAAGKGKQAAAAPTLTESLEPKTINAGGPTAFAPVPLADGIAWITDAGTLVALEPTKQGWLRHELPLGDAPAGQPVARGRTLVVTTGPVGAAWPATLVRIELADPLAKDKPRPGLAIAWRIPLPDHPEGSPIIAGDTIVVCLGQGGIAAVSATTGSLLWRSDIVGRLVAAGGGRVWCVDETGRLSGLDLASGIRRARLCMAGLTLPVVNTASDAVVLAAPGGLVMSSAPVPTGLPGPEPSAEDPDARRP